MAHKFVPHAGLPCGVLVVGFVTYAAAEVAAFVLVANQIGYLWAVLAVVVVSALGPFVLWHVGLGVLGRTRDRLARGEPPTRDILDGLVVLIGGFILCVPGFIGDAVGILLMFRPVRHLVIRVAGHRLARRAQAVQVGRWRVVSARSRPSRSGPLGGPPAVPPDGRSGRSDQAGN